MAAMNKVQFQAGMSLGLFLHRYGDESKCEDAVEKQRWPKGYACAGCGHRGHYVVRHGRVKTFQCIACRSQVTLTSGTIFHGSKLPLTKWFQAMYFLTQSKNNVSAFEGGFKYQGYCQLAEPEKRVVKSRGEKPRNG